MITNILTYSVYDVINNCERDWAYTHMLSYAIIMQQRYETTLHECTYVQASFALVCHVLSLKYNSPEHLQQVVHALVQRLKYM